MRTTVIILVLLAVFSIFIFRIGAEVEKAIKVGPGMELLEVGTVRVIVPKGTQYKDKGSWIEVETTEEFIGRRMIDIESRFSAIEEREKALSQEVNMLKTQLEYFIQQQQKIHVIEDDKEGKRISP